MGDLAWAGGFDDSVAAVHQIQHTPSVGTGVQGRVRVGFFVTAFGARLLSTKPRYVAWRMVASLHSHKSQANAPATGKRHTPKFSTTPHAGHRVTLPRTPGIGRDRV